MLAAVLLLLPDPASHACPYPGNADLAISLLREMSEIGLQPDVVSYTTAIDACASVGDALKAKDLLEEMRERGVVPNHRSFNAVMSAFAKAGDPQQAIAMLAVRPHSHHPFSSAVLHLLTQSRAAAVWWLCR